MYGYYSYGSSGLEGAAVTVVLSVVFALVALVGGIILYFTVFSKKNEKKYTGIMKWLYDFVHFRILTIEAIIKIAYIVAAISITLSAFLTFSAGLIGLLLCPLTIIIGNILVRIAYEFAIMIILITKNTSDINAKLKDENGGAKNDIFSASLPVIEKKARPAAPANGTKFCSGCGKALDADAKFCDGCGKKCD